MSFVPKLESGAGGGEGSEEQGAMGKGRFVLTVCQRGVGVDWGLPV